jgi:hypothetical protein
LDGLDQRLIEAGHRGAGREEKQAGMARIDAPSLGGDRFLDGRT